MHTHVSKCKNDKIKGERKIKNRKKENCKVLNKMLNTKSGKLKNNTGD
jgi:hypothetical protein